MACNKKYQVMQIFPQLQKLCVQYIEGMYIYKPETNDTILLLLQSFSQQLKCMFQQHKIIKKQTLDIKDMHVNLPTEGILRAAKTGLQKTANSLEMNKQIMILLSIIMEQNYFQYNKQCYKPKKGIAMGSPLSGYLAEIYIQEIEETDVKHWLESKEIIYYKRYVDDIFIIYNQSKTNEIQILIKSIK